MVSLLSVVPLKIGGNVSENAVYCKNTNTFTGLILLGTGTNPQEGDDLDLKVFGNIEPCLEGVERPACPPYQEVFWSHTIVSHESAPIVQDGWWDTDFD